MIHDYIGSQICGQQQLKEQINFYIDGYRKTSFLKPLLFSSSRGAGKTTFCRLIAKNLIPKEGSVAKQYVEINSASIKSPSAWIDNVFSPYILGRDVTVLYDEYDRMPKETATFLLSAWPAGDSKIVDLFYDGSKITLDYTKLTALACTTNCERITEAAKSRFTRLEMQPYELKDIVEIIHRKITGDFFIEKDVDYDIAGVCRASPREAVNLIKDIRIYMADKFNNIFDKNDWNQLKEILGINVLGLRKHEIALLKFLSNCGRATLTTISAFLELDTTTVRSDVEKFLLKHHLIQIDGRRHITQKGQEILKLCS